MIPVWQCSCGCKMGWRGFWPFLGQSSSCRWVMMCIANVHCGTGVLARVCVHFGGERGVH